MLCRYTPLFPQPLATASIALSFPEYHKLGIIPYVACSNWHFSLSNTPLSFFHIFLWFGSSFLLVLNNILLSRCLDVPHTIYLRIHLLKDHLWIFISVTVIFSSKISIWSFVIAIALMWCFIYHWIEQSSQLLAGTFLYLL